ncbi:hypothetical protein C8F04DRAFT_1183354 [Mycena alexandri]|uniref:Uncharacterized protein n=1 Tax=Mycena alexandri TaxID=1745969 RepID=A0AAD6SUZ0_9AGAR|nr:hypothetical protein C8F04DRAFT_1183354 [Mycena alexandri]
MTPSVWVDGRTSEGDSEHHEEETKSNTPYQFSLDSVVPILFIVSHDDAEEDKESWGHRAPGHKSSGGTPTSAITMGVQGRGGRRAVARKMSCTRLFTPDLMVIYFGDSVAGPSCPTASSSSRPFQRDYTAETAELEDFNAYGNFHKVISKRSFDVSLLESSSFKSPECPANNPWKRSRILSQFGHQTFWKKYSSFVSYLLVLYSPSSSVPTSITPMLVICLGQVPRSRPGWFQDEI